jgi:hypothetical protein
VHDAVIRYKFLKAILICKHTQKLASSCYNISCATFLALQHAKALGLIMRIKMFWA